MGCVLIFCLCSSLLRGLLWLTKIETDSIQLDEVDVRKIGHNALRSSLSIIMQDPVLLSGRIGKGLARNRT